jgi:hypothetical protein
MTRKSIQEINFSSNKDDQRKTAKYKKSMPISRCTCGFEILVVPDLKAMNFAINKHLNAHKKTHNCSEEKLTEHVLIVAGKMNLATLN